MKPRKATEKKLCSQEGQSLSKLWSSRGSLLDTQTVVDLDRGGAEVDPDGSEKQCHAEVHSHCEDIYLVNPRPESKARNDALRIPNARTFRR